MLLQISPLRTSPSATFSVSLLQEFSLSLLSVPEILLSSPPWKIQQNDNNEDSWVLKHNRKWHDIPDIYNNGHGNFIVSETNWLLKCPMYDAAIWWLPLHTQWIKWDKWPSTVMKWKMKHLSDISHGQSLNQAVRGQWPTSLPVRSWRHTLFVPST